MLKRMKQEVENIRPQVLRSETVELLKPYLGFRHFFRHSYSSEIKWDKINPLAEEVETVYQRFKADVENFLEKLSSHL